MCSGPHPIPPLPHLLILTSPLPTPHPHPADPQRILVAAATGVCLRIACPLLWLIFQVRGRACRAVQGESLTLLAWSLSTVPPELRSASGLKLPLHKPSQSSCLLSSNPAPASVSQMTHMSGTLAQLKTDVESVADPWHCPTQMYCKLVKYGNPLRKLRDVYKDRG